MAKPIPVPTLSGAGWVTSASEKADYLISHWFEADKSQTLLYPGEVSSCQFVIQEAGNDPIALTTRLKSDLEKYLGRYYENRLVEIKTPDGILANVTRYEVRIFAQVQENNQIYSFGRLLQISNSKIERIARLNNTGEVIA